MALIIRDMGEIGKNGGKGIITKFPESIPNIAPAVLFWSPVHDPVLLRSAEPAIFASPLCTLLLLLQGKLVPWDTKGL